MWSTAFNVDKIIDIFQKQLKQKQSPEFIKTLFEFAVKNITIYPDKIKVVLLVTQERFELPTPWFVVKCSIQLSYWAVYGRGRGTQTPNLRFWRPLLYQLRYAPIFLHRYHLCDCNIITNIFGKSKQFSKMIPLLPFFNRLFSL